jgi:hypothetical protein
VVVQCGHGLAAEAVGELSAAANGRDAVARGKRQVSGLAARQVGRQEKVGRDNARGASVRETVTLREEVRPMNAVSRWVLPVFSRSGD